MFNAGWSWVLITQGRKLRSPALAADGRHLFSDVVTSVGVVVGIVLAVATGWAILDPLLAALVAVNMLWSGWRVIRESLGGLMDEAVPAARLEQIRGVIALNADGRDRGARRAHPQRRPRRLHRLPPRRAGADERRRRPRHLRPHRARRSGRRSRGRCITIHVEPEEKAKANGVVVL